MFTPLVVARPLLLVCCIAVASAAAAPPRAAIRPFPIRTIEKLGRELYQQTQRPQNLTGPQQHAKRVAVDALPRLSKQKYRFIVLSDPERKGYLVYALATSGNPQDIVVGLHYRVSVSAEGKVERVDPLAGSDLVIRPGEGLPSGYHPAGFYCSCMVSNQPVETLVYLTLLHHQPCVVGMWDYSTWVIENGKISKGEKKK
jgi:hypothetical protein